MTYIEFFDKTFIENICASLTNPPERVILIGDKRKLLESQAKNYAEVLRERGYEVEFDYKCVNRNDLRNIVDVLSELIEAYGDCVFDLTGGEDMFLVATGIIFERYKDRNIQMHRFNIGNNTIQDCDFDGKTIMESKLPQLTVDENIRIYGGDVVYDNVLPHTTPVWDFSGDFAGDIDIMWDICRDDVRLWNTQIGVFMQAEQLNNCGGDALTVTAPLCSLKEQLASIGAKYVYANAIIRRLSSAGLIKAQADAETFSISYKNGQVRRCLTKAGQILEMKIYISALRARDKDMQYIYNDVKNGVYIDWDGDIHTEQDGHDTQNEIDVMMMHGMVPVFVSCKNGRIEMDELYKLNTVATRFGGKYAKKVLVATALDEESRFTIDLRSRAREMKIKIFPESDKEKIQDMDDAELQRKIKSFWNT